MAGTSVTSAGMVDVNGSSVEQEDSSDVVEVCEWWEVLLGLYPIFPGVLLFSCVVHIVTRRWGKIPGSVSWWLELVVCVCPSVVALMYLHEWAAVVSGGLTLLAVAAAAVVVYNTGIPRVDVKGKQSLGFYARLELKMLTAPQRLAGISGAVAMVRAVVALTTAICILAVDFTTFPTKLSKTDGYGWSLMDVGAAGFVLINAVVDARPQRGNSLSAGARQCTVLCVLGSARLLLLRATDYNQSVTEYGVHANFFFLLAAVKVCCWWVSRPIWPSLLAAAGTALTLLQQLLNPYWHNWVFSDAPRDEGLLDANREAVVAVPGYCALYCWGALLGKLIFSESSFDRNIEREPSSLRTPTKATAAVPARSPLQVMWWMAATAAVAAVFLVVLVYGPLQQMPSRRLANPAFIVWMVFLLVVFLWLAAVLEVFLVWIDAEPPVPFILQSVNEQQLLLFLVANVCTGAVNLSMDTMAVVPPRDTLLLLAYTTGLCLLLRARHRPSVPRSPAVAAAGAAVTAKKLV